MGTNTWCDGRHSKFLLGAVATCTGVRAFHNCTGKTASHDRHIFALLAVPNRLNPNPAHQQLDQLALSLEGQRLVKALPQPREERLRAV